MQVDDILADQPGRKRLIPRGLDPLLHAEMSKAATPPLVSEAPLADDLRFAWDVVYEQHENISSWRRRNWRLLQRVCKPLEQLSPLYDLQRSYTSAKVSAHLEASRWDAGRFSICWPDSTVASGMIVEGAPIVGEMPMVNISAQSPCSLPDTGGLA